MPRLSVGFGPARVGGGCALLLLAPMALAGIAVLGRLLLF